MSAMDPFVRLTLPFFEAGHLTVHGSFGPAGGQQLQIAGGELRGDGFGDGVVVPDGSFALVNDRVLRLEERPTLDVSLREAQDFLIRPVRRPLLLDLQPGHELSVGPFAVERYEVPLDRVPVEVQDVTGARLGAPLVQVGVNGESAAVVGEVFEGKGVFRKTTDQLVVTATMPFGDQTVEGTARVTLADVPVWESPVLPDPVRITLQVFGPGRLSVVGSTAVVDVPAGRPAPVDVLLRSPLFPGDWGHRLGERFSLSSPDPVRVGTELEVTAEAEADGVRYAGLVRTTLGGTSAVVDVGEMVLRPALTAADTGAADTTSAPGATLDDVLRDLDPLTSSLERERDDAKARCDWAGAAGAQRRIIGLVDRWLTSVFPAGVPAEVAVMQEDVRVEAAGLDRAESAERTAEELLATARVEAGAGQSAQALATLRDAAAVPDLPSCELDAIDAAMRELAGETALLVRQAVEAANQCDFVAAVRFGDQVAAIDPNLEWVQTDLLEFRANARAQERAERLMDQAAAARAAGDPSAAGQFAEQALGVAPTCDHGWIQGFLQSLVAPSGAAPAVAVDRSVVLLIDASGSMGSDGRIESARSAAQHTVRSLGPNVEVALITYSGGCGGGWRVVHDFTVDHATMENAIAGVSPGGGTPMAPAVGFAQDHLERNGRGASGQILLLSDGQNDCGGEGAVRDAGARIRSSSIPIQLDGVGLGLESGGTAETQLGDLVRAAGTGKQYSANSAEELYRAFRRASLSGQVKTDDPLVDGPSRVRLAELYRTALAYLQADDFEAARLTFEQAAREHPGSASAQFNLSLAYEAEGRTLSAIESARRYVDLAPGAPDRSAVEERIRSLETLQRDRPNAIFEPGRCPQLYAWARGESGRVREPERKALAFSILTAAQRGDCAEADRLYEAYLTRYGG
jgi:Mg-chelatase subunit ChlD